MRYDLHSLAVFETAAATGSIASAAARHNTAASAVSKRISDLERRLGAKLFYRQRRGIELTEAGRDLLRHARNLLKAMQVMEADMGIHAGGTCGSIRIAANTSAITQFLPEDLTEFVSIHPDIRIQLAEKTSADILDDVRSGLVEVGIFSGFNSAENLTTMVYRRDTLVVAVANDHALGAKKSVRLADLLDEDFVALRQGSSIQAYLERRATDLNRRMNIRVEVMSFDGVRRMVQARLGIAILPHGAVEPYLDQSQLRMVPLDEPWAQRDILIAIRDRKLLTKQAAALVTFLVGDGLEAAELRDGTGDPAS